MIKVKWTDRIREAEASTRTGEKRKLLESHKKRKHLVSFKRQNYECIIQCDYTDPTLNIDNNNTDVNLKYFVT